VAADDELSTPLGQKTRKGKPSKLPKLPISVPQLLAGARGLFGLVAVGWAMLANDPLGGEPVAVVVTGPLLHGQNLARGNNPGATSDGASAAGKPAQNPAAPQKAAAQPVPPPGSQTITIIDGSSGTHHDVVVPGKAGPHASIDRRLLETTPHGSIPKVARDGTRALAFYARPIKLPANRKDAPRIAVIVGGLGISARSTAEALARLPASVTLAFAPYGDNLESLAEQARMLGHELLLQVPMEPFDYPSNDPGPRTLLTTLSTAQNIDRLHWLMARFQGYVGLISYMGARFTSSEQALAPVLSDTAKRGLIYVDDGASPRSIAAQLAGSNNVPFAKTNIVLDTVPTPNEIKRALARLEMTARENGLAIGLASAQPASITTIAAWAKQVEEHGFMLVPITMVAVKAKST